MKKKTEPSGKIDEKIIIVTYHELKKIAEFSKNKGLIAQSE
jgi:hypothetical protein